MVHHEGTNIKFLPLLLVLVLVCMEYDFGFVLGEIRCLQKEREALLKFKQGLTDNAGILSFWGNGDNKKECCKWPGVVCSNMTGHVTGLQLQLFGIGGKIGSALLELHYLNFLDLSLNDFGGDRIPEFIGSIKMLEHLYLVGSNFSGIIPPQLGNLTNLRTLDLSFGLVGLDIAYNYLRSDNLNWLSHLSLLSRVDLSFSDLSDTNWPLQVLKLPSLHEMYLHECMIPDATFSTSLFTNSSSTPLSILDLSYNQLTSSTFDRLFNISMSLVRLDLSHNQLDGPIPDAFENFIFLEYLDLSYNVLVHGIPKSLGNLSHLQTLYLFQNDLRESVPESLGQLSKLENLDLSSNSLEGTISEANFMKLHSLWELDLSFNSLTLDLSPDWIPPFRLESINLAGCKIGPSFPKWLQTQVNFTYLDISSTGVSDEVPKWLWNLSSEIQYLNLSHNQISGTIPDLSSIFFRVFYVSSNKFSGPVPLPSLNASFFQLSRNMFSGPISSICTFSLTLFFLDLSSNQLTGALPNCWENMANLLVLNLNNNNFSSEIPHSFGSLESLISLHLSGNNLSGEFPSILKNCQFLQLIDIGGNKLTGNISSWLSSGNNPNMTYLSLRHNRFYGDIPPRICYLTQIQMLDLSQSNISGKLSNCFNNFTSLVDKSMTTTNMIEIPIGDDEYIDFALVQWKGEESEYRNTLELLKLIDLSSNRLVGDIPRTLFCLRGLISLNVSRNNLTGIIDSNIGNMEMLEILDLSRNQLRGEIPIGLAQLHYLAVLDLSNNKLCGKIPSSTQLQSFNVSAYARNSELCGLPLALCPGDRPTPPISNQGENGGTDPDEDVWFLSTSFIGGPWISVILGFIVGFWGVVGSLLLKKSWRTAYFNFWDGIEDWLFVTTTLILRKFKRN